MGFTTLGLMLGYGCNAHCRSCLWGDLINYPARMTVEEACRWVDQAYELGSLMLVGLSGGEPFLYRREMEAIFRYSRDRYHLPSVAATNAFWATTEARATEILGRLHELGLERLLISVDDFHQEWVPLERVANCLRAARSFEIACTLQCVTTRASRQMADYLALLNVERGEKLEAMQIACTPVGSAATMIPADDFALVPGIPADYCTILQALVVRPEGKVHLCCGPAFTVGPLLSGNLHDEKLKDIISRAEWDPVYNALALGNGPARLADALRQAGRADFLLPAYASSCHACQHILSQPGVPELLYDLLEPQRPELFLKRTILEQITVDRSADILQF